MGYEACLALPVSDQVLCLLRVAPGVGTKAWWALNSQGQRLPLSLALPSPFGTGGHQPPPCA